MCFKADLSDTAVLPSSRTHVEPAAYQKHSRIDVFCSPAYGYIQLENAYYHCAIDVARQKMLRLYRKYRRIRNLFGRAMHAPTFSLVVSALHLHLRTHQTLLPFRRCLIRGSAFAMPDKGKNIPPCVACKAGSLFLLHYSTLARKLCRRGLLGASKI